MLHVWLDGRKDLGFIYPLEQTHPTHQFWNVNTCVCVRIRSFNQIFCYFIRVPKIILFLRWKPRTDGTRKAERGDHKTTYKSHKFNEINTELPIIIFRKRLANEWRTDSKAINHRNFPSAIRLLSFGDPFLNSWTFFSLSLVSVYCSCCSWTVLSGWAAVCCLCIWNDQMRPLTNAVKMEIALLCLSRAYN